MHKFAKRLRDLATALRADPVGGGRKLCHKGRKRSAMPQIAPQAQLNTFFSIARLLAGQLDFLSAIRAVAAEIAGTSRLIVVGLVTALIAARLLSAVGLSRSLGPSFARQAGA